MTSCREGLSDLLRVQQGQHADISGCRVQAGHSKCTYDCRSLIWLTYWLSNASLSETISLASHALHVALPVLLAHAHHHAAAGGVAAATAARVTTHRIVRAANLHQWQLSVSSQTAGASGRCSCAACLMTMLQLRACRGGSAAA